jgi:predicted anti-sigma-YlaC factor YlaD
MHTDYTMLMSAALDHEATPDELQRLREHVRTCAACAGVWEQWQAVDRRLEMAPLVAPAPAFAEAVMARVEAYSFRRRRSRLLGSSLAAVLLTVSVLGAALLGLLIYWGIQDPGQASGVFFAILKGAGMAAWILLGLLRLMGGIGAPTIAACIGLLATATCLFSMLWLWVIGRRQSLAAEPASAS